MRHHRSDVVEHAIAVLDAYGLADLTMRRLASELDVRPSALYHHFANKQTLLAAVADELLARGLRPVDEGEWDVRLTQAASQVRDALLAWRDGAELVATVHAFGLGGRAAYDHVAEALEGCGLDEQWRATAARTVLHLVFGHATAEQTHVQASSAGAIDGEVAAVDDFSDGLSLVVAGIRAEVDSRRAS
ncbi:TetR/AcrR family transcriptional regulator C-terminal domain-containing protein [Nocardioides jishulii]|uniref:TetR family transcriptional regulator n=1 Tax=Nocardioides jishulii TaxID=2575440 RepID=A0A4V5TJZ1_9ACTN|nr:TetR/AcrR family transcriptional regulator C-terminal domain-containing protein [Nocardioides jishulii]QCX27011.1 TetR family transcriptional regulator [Nocardioides jishulii]TKI61493.1 TetR family transcriptional regulator [Nocardioides jishulii]